MSVDNSIASNVFRVQEKQQRISHVLQQEGRCHREARPRALRVLEARLSEQHLPQKPDAPQQRAPNETRREILPLGIGPGLRRRQRFPGHLLARNGRLDQGPVPRGFRGLEQLPFALEHLQQSGAVHRQVHEAVGGPKHGQRDRGRGAGVRLDPRDGRVPRAPVERRPPREQLRDDVFLIPAFARGLAGLFVLRGRVRCGRGQLRGFGRGAAGALGDDLPRLGRRRRDRSLLIVGRRPPFGGRESRHGDFGLAQPRGRRSLGPTRRWSRSPVQ
ncbi:hypothetical protein DFJ74DRAFT_665536 [Hyaloraphidium curvatum]|nr:hypothetical protein DFJ74DRAFT_665536 [Hyaloraphidium curvatum]